MNKPLAIGISLWLIIASAMFFAACSADSISDRIKAERANYTKACDRGQFNKAEACAEKLAALYKDTGDNENAKFWEDIKRDVLITAAMPESAAKPIAATQQHDAPRATYNQTGTYTEAEMQEQVQSAIKSFRDTDEDHRKYEEQIVQTKADEARKLKDQQEAATIARNKYFADTAAKQKDIQAAADKETDRILAERHAREKKEKYKLFVEGSPIRPWKTFGGKEASRAKIVRYESGVFTLEKPDGKQIELRESRMVKADKDYCEEWLSNAGITD